VLVVLVAAIVRPRCRRVVADEATGSTVQNSRGGAPYRDRATAAQEPVRAIGGAAPEPATGPGAEGIA
jgi:hypothetical protein